MNKNSKPLIKLGQGDYERHYYDDDIDALGESKADFLWFMALVGLIVVVLFFTGVFVGMMIA